MRKEEIKKTVEKLITKKEMIRPLSEDIELACYWLGINSVEEKEKEIEGLFVEYLFREEGVKITIFPRGENPRDFPTTTEEAWGSLVEEWFETF